MLETQKAKLPTVNCANKVEQKEKSNNENISCRYGQTVELFFGSSTIVLSIEAVKHGGNALIYADDSLKKDKEVVLEAVKESGDALEYADDKLRADKEVVLEAIKVDIINLSITDEKLRADKKFMLEVIKQNGEALGYVDDSLKNDPDILAIVNKDK